MRVDEPFRLGSGRYGLCICDPPASRLAGRSPHGRGVTMSKLLRGVAAGYGAKKMGGGCFSTVIIFIILWYVLGHFGVFK
jgi:hypothetical protein